MLLDDELSDARLGLTTPIETLLTPVLDDSNKSNVSLNALGELAQKDSKTVVTTTTQEMTVDPKEKERLNDSLSLAGWVIVSHTQRDGLVSLPIIITPSTVSIEFSIHCTFSSDPADIVPRLVLYVVKIFILSMDQFYSTGCLGIVVYFSNY